MLADITYIWFLTLPSLLTGLILLRKLQRLKEEAEARSPVPAAIARRK